MKLRLACAITGNGKHPGQPFPSSNLDFSEFDVHQTLNSLNQFTALINKITMAVYFLRGFCGIYQLDQHLCGTFSGNTGKMNIFCGFGKGNFDFHLTCQGTEPRPILQRQKVNNCYKYLEGTQLSAFICFAFLTVNTETRTWKQRERDICGVIVKILAMQRNKTKRIFCIERISILPKSANSRQISFVSFCWGFILCSDQFFSDGITHYAANRPYNCEKRDSGLSPLTCSLACAYLQGQYNLNQKKPYRARIGYTGS